MLLVAALLVAYGLFRFIKEIRNGFRKFLVSDRFVLSAYLVVPAAFFYIVSAYISPWVVDRYVMPAIPFICAMVVIVFWNGAGIFVRNRYMCAALIAVFISLIYVRSFRLSPNYAFPITAEKTEFANAYQSYDALMIDPVNDSEYLEVVADIEHPFWTLMKDDHISDYLEDDFEKNIDHVVYFNQYCDADAILQDFENADCPLISCGYSTDFFDVYEYTAR